MSEDEILEVEDEALVLRMEGLLRRAAMMTLLARGFAYPGAGHHQELVGQMTAMGSGMPGVEEPFAAFKTRWGGENPELLEAEHIRLFQGRNLVSLHETSYGDARRIGGQVVELSDLNGFYQAFGMQVAESNPEMPDHLCTELEFYSLLLIKQAYALDNGWEEHDAVTGDAARKFLEMHLGRWVTPMLITLREQGGETVYGLLGELLDQVIQVECRTLEVVPQPFSGVVHLDDMHADEFTCPMGGRTELPEP